MRICSICGGPIGLLGRLGRLNHYQCRNCGAEFSEPVDENEDTTRDDDHDLEDER